MSAGAPTFSRPHSVFAKRETRLTLLGLVALSGMLWLFSRTLFATDFLPHWYCFVGNKRLLWTNVAADLLIGLSYVAISLALASIAHRSKGNVPYSGFFWAFGLFIVSCGVTHFLEVVTI